MCWLIREMLPNAELKLEPRIVGGGGRHVEIVISIVELIKHDVDKGRLYFPTSGIGKIVLTDALPNKLGQVLIELEAMTYLKKVSHLLQLEPVAVVLNEDVRQLSLMPESAWRPLRYKVQKTRGKSLYFRLDDSLCLSILVGLDHAGVRIYFMLLLIGFFVHLLAFGSISLEFRNLVVR